MSDRKAWDIIEWASKVLAIDEKGTNSTLSRDLIGAAKTLEQAGVAWISVKDRLPEPGVRVLATHGKYIDIASMSSSGTWGDPFDRAAFYSGRQVTHWMPLPKPPEVKS